MEEMLLQTQANILEGMEDQVEEQNQIQDLLELLVVVIHPQQLLLKEMMVVMLHPQAHQMKIILEVEEQEE